MGLVFKYIYAAFLHEIVCENTFYPQGPKITPAMRQTEIKCEFGA